MTTAVFVAPYCMETTLRFVRAAANLPGVRLGLISQDPAEQLPAALRQQLAGHYRIDQGLDSAAISHAVQQLSKSLGPTEKLLGTLEQLQVPLAQVREHLGIDGLGVEAAQNLRDKSRMKDVLRAADLPCARHRLVQSSGDLLEFVREVGFPIIVKPPAGAAAKDTFRVDHQDALLEYLKHYPPRQEDPTLAEEFIRGEEHSFDSVCIHGQPVWYSISRYYPAPLQVIQNPWIQWCVLLPREVEGPEYHPIRDVGFRAVQALGLTTGLSHLEWFRTESGRVVISEVGARPPGAQFTSLISYAYDFDLYQAYAHLMVFDEFPTLVRGYSCGAAYLRGQGQGRVRAVHGLEDAQREFGPLVVEARLPQEGRPSASGYEGDGYVIVRHPDTEVVKQALSRIVEMIQVELA
jgi:formate-dependent phosphoribosylglycinamide formyltransferase (GAR transformylase)